MAPVEIFRTRWSAKKATNQKRGALTPPVDNLARLLAQLAQRQGYDLLEDEQRVLRACLVLAGGTIPLRGFCDLDFFVALDRFQMEHGTKGGLSPAAIAQILAAARHVVGATGFWGRARGAWFDAFDAPALLAEVSSMALLIRALRRSA
ncbi:MAG: hypothetical protein JWM80_6129 [Cyanobacteria bacterium RYN_339]|nr:hypothetical protein [Cyanobacteria bacterium RYN_339]